jgi:CTD small phosphatase-like protein 2
VIEVLFPLNICHFVKAGVNIRPGASDIIKELSYDFEVIIFTASHDCYADAVCDYLDPHNKFIDYRLYREDCV